MNVFIFPNLSLVGNDIGVVTPVEVNRTEIHWKVTVLVGEPDDVLAVRMRIAEDFPNFGDPDDVENWERAQRGLESVPESEWLHSGRGNGPSDGDLVGVTDEAPMRSFHQEWARLMSSPGVSR